MWNSWNILRNGAWRTLDFAPYFTLKAVKDYEFFFVALIIPAR